MAIKKTSRELKAEQTINHIISVGRVLFSEYSFDRVTIDDICTHANVSKSTFYTHFNSKQDLLMLFAGAERNQFLSEHYVYDDSIPFKTQMRDFFFANFNYNRKDNRAWSRDTYISYIKTYNQIPLKDDFYQDNLRLLIDRGMKENAFKQDLTAEEHFHMIHDWIVGFFMGWSLYPENTVGIENTYDRIMNAMIDALIK